MFEDLAAALWRAVRGFMAHDGVIHSGYIAYVGLLAFCPFVIFLVGLASLLGSAEALDRFIALSSSLLPADVASTLQPLIREALQGSSATLLIIIPSVWAASSGVEALRAALDHVHGPGRVRPFWPRRLQGLAFVAVASFAVLFAMAVVVIAPLVWSIVSQRFGTPPGVLWLWFAARYALAALVLFASLLLVYRFLPGVRHPLGWHVPGAVLTSLLWLALAGSYTLLLEETGRHRIVYGSIAGIVATLFFFFLSAAVVIFGAEFNAGLRDRSRLTDRRAQA
jgi:membrane protein